MSCGHARFENVEAHDVAHGVVEREREEIEIDNGVETLGKVVEERGQIALLSDGLANFEQGFELTAGVLVLLVLVDRREGRRFRRQDDRVRHTCRIASGLSGAQPETRVANAQEAFCGRPTFSASAAFAGWIRQSNREDHSRERIPQKLPRRDRLPARNFLELCRAPASWDFVF